MTETLSHLQMDPAAKAGVLNATEDRQGALNASEGRQGALNASEGRPTGLFISFEGNDGSGKTTQIRCLIDWFQEQAREVILLREPGGTPIGEKIREVVLDPVNLGMEPVTEMLLYAASRAQLVHSVIRPAVERGCVVLCDRFVDSSYAYQGFGRNLGLETVRAANAPAIGGMMPHLTIFLDLDADTSMARRHASGMEADRLEREAMDFHRRAHDGYLQLCREEPERIRRIPVMLGQVQRTPEEVAAQIRGEVESCIRRIAEYAHPCEA